MQRWMSDGRMALQTEVAIEVPMVSPRFASEFLTRSLQPNPSQDTIRPRIVAYNPV